MPQSRQIRTMPSSSIDFSFLSTSAGTRLTRSNLPPSPAERPVLSTSCSRSETATRIAVAEDENELRLYFSRVLPHLGYHVVGLASSGEELVRLCHQTRPDILITDVQMSGMPGTEAVSVIRQIYPVAAVYVAENAVEDRAARRAGHAALLTKPFRMSDLSPAIQQGLRIRPYGSGHQCDARIDPTSHTELSR
ncbi:MAG: response regulator [Fuerstiella sp.]